MLAPLLAIPYFLGDYHRRYVGETLPAVLGLTTAPDLPALAAVLVAAYFTARAAVGGDRLDGLAAGLAAGLALAIKPVDAVFLPAPFLALAVARRWRAGGSCSGSASCPRSSASSLWKERGLGYVPLFSNGLAHDFPFDWALLKHNLDNFREFGWSKRLVEWAVLAGLVGLGRRSLALATLAGSLARLLRAAQGRFDRGLRERGLLPPAGLGLPGGVPAHGLAAAARSGRRPHARRVGRSAGLAWHTAGAKGSSSGSAPRSPCSRSSPCSRLSRADGRRRRSRCRAVSSSRRGGST